MMTKINGSSALYLLSARSATYPENKSKASHIWLSRLAGMFSGYKWGNWYFPSPEMTVLILGLSFLGDLWSVCRSNFSRPDPWRWPHYSPGCHAVGSSCLGSTLWGWEEMGISCWEQSLRVRGSSQAADLHYCYRSWRGQGWWLWANEWETNVGILLRLLSSEHWVSDISFWLLLLFSILMQPRAGLGVPGCHSVTLLEQTHLALQLWLHGPCGRKHISSGLWHPLAEVRLKSWFKKENRLGFHHVLCCFGALQRKLIQLPVTSIYRHCHPYRAPISGSTKPGVKKATSPLNVTGTEGAEQKLEEKPRRGKIFVSW